MRMGIPSRFGSGLVWSDLTGLDKTEDRMKFVSFNTGI